MKTECEDDSDVIMKSNKRKSICQAMKVVSTSKSDVSFENSSFLRKLQVYILLNKKVLLRERKRHTVRHVASARYAA